jgi:hypothetical protein
LYRELYRHECGHGSHTVVARRRFPWRQQAVAVRRRFPWRHHFPILVYTRASRVGTVQALRRARPAWGRHEYVHETPWRYCTVPFYRFYRPAWGPAWGRHEYVHETPWRYCTVPFYRPAWGPAWGRHEYVHETPWLYCTVVFDRPMARGRHEYAPDVRSVVARQLDWRCFA